MDNARSFQVGTTDESALSRKAVASLKVMLLAFVLAAASTSSTFAASVQIVHTDGSWLATNVAPAGTWNTDPAFDTTGWINASVNTPACFMDADCIWYDGENSATRYAWLRKTFTLSSTVFEAVLIGGIDDDCEIYINGNLVFNDHNGSAEAFGPIDVTPYMVQGVNLIAVATDDNIPVYGQQHAFEATLTIDLTEGVPTLSRWMFALFALALASLAFVFIGRNT